MFRVPVRGEERGEKPKQRVSSCTEYGLGSLIWQVAKRSDKCLDCHPAKGNEFLKQDLKAYQDISICIIMIKS